MADTVPDRIEKKIVLRAPRSRVWKALTDAREFSEWFRVKLEGQFAEGKVISGPVTYPGYEYLTMTAWVERIEPEQLFSFRWHPAAIDPKADYSKEPTTTVEFRLEDTPEGTLLTVTESGFRSLPAARQGPAYESNSGGWEEQLRNIERHVAQRPSPRG
ncbi:MAG TPA: SRPBCC family protein [Myxococcaceae bacterium]|nr:SRPBCC family protein [Myxococcaceae bacterium]